MAEILTHRGMLGELADEYLLSRPESLTGPDPCMPVIIFRLRNAPVRRRGHRGEALDVCPLWGPGAAPGRRDVPGLDREWRGLRQGRRAPTVHAPWPEWKPSATGCARRSGRGPLRDVRAMWKRRPPVERLPMLAPSVPGAPGRVTSLRTGCAVDVDTRRQLRRSGRTEPPGSAVTGWHGLSGPGARPVVSGRSRPVVTRLATSSAHAAPVFGSTSSTCGKKNGRWTATQCVNVAGSTPRSSRYSLTRSVGSHHGSCRSTPASPVDRRRDGVLFRRRHGDISHPMLTRSVRFA
jgi:hypothetical protein